MEKASEIKTLGEVCIFQRGLTYSKSDEVDVSDNIVLRASNVDLATSALNFNDLKFISESVIVPKNKRVCKHSIIICTASGSKSHLGKVAYIDEDYGYAFGGFMGQITAQEAVTPKFLFYAMCSEAYVKFIRERSDGVNINNLKFDDLKHFQIPIPPLDEQKRLVAILDAAFNGISEALANAEKNRANARAVFESALENLVLPKQNWIKSTLGKSVRFIDYRGKTPVKTADGVRLITAKNVKMGYVQEAPMEFIASDNYIAWMTRGIPQEGDVLFTTEAPLANVAQLDTSEKVAFAQRIIIMQTEKTALNNTFLKYLLLSKTMQKRIHDKGTGATVKGIKASLLKTIEIAFPLIAEQQSIITKLNALSTETQNLESLYQQKITALNHLKKSLLQQAFSGNL